MLMGTRSAAVGGAVLLYRSDDLLNCFRSDSLSVKGVHRAELTMKRAAFCGLNDIRKVSLF